MNIGFTGHRDCIANEQSLLRIEERYPGATWIHGGAKGFDRQVDAIARLLGKVEGETLLIFKPNYELYKSTVAPILRNKAIVEDSNRIVACYDGRRKGGTYFTINYAKDKGLEVDYLTPYPLGVLP